MLFTGFEQQEDLEELCQGLLELVDASVLQPDGLVQGLPRRFGESRLGIASLSPPKDLKAS